MARAEKKIDFATRGPGVIVGAQPLEAPWNAVQAEI